MFDDGVVAVLGLHKRELLGAGGDKAEVPPVVPQLGPVAEQAGAAHDQPAAVVDGLGDLRLAVMGGSRCALPGVLVDRFHGLADGLDHRAPFEYCQPARSRRPNTFMLQEPESACSS